MVAIGKQHALVALIEREFDRALEAKTNALYFESHQAHIENATLGKFHTQYDDACHAAHQLAKNQLEYRFLQTLRVLPLKPNFHRARLNFPLPIAKNLCDQHALLIKHPYLIYR